MTNDGLTAILAIAIISFAIAVGSWLGLKLVRGSDLRQEQPRLRKIITGIWIAGAVAAGAWFFSGGWLTFANACFGFVLASIVVFAAFRNPKGR